MQSLKLNSGVSKFKRNAAFLAALSMYPLAGSVRAELVLSSAEETAPRVAAPGETEDRDEIRKVLQVSEKAEATRNAGEVQDRRFSGAPPRVQSALGSETYLIPNSEGTSPQLQAPGAMPMNTGTQQSAVPVVSTAQAPATEVQNLSKSELMRRERVRAEVRNEDLLQERLEELRLRDEKRRSEELLGGGGLRNGNSQKDLDSGAEMSARRVASPTISEEVVVPSVTETPGKRPASMAVNPGLNRQQTASFAAQEAGSLPHSQSGTSVAALSVVPQYSDSVYSTQGAGVVMQQSNVRLAGDEIKDTSEKTYLSIQPRAGLVNFASGVRYDIRPRFSLGLGLGVAASEHISFDAGYTFSEVGIAQPLSNPYVYAYQAWSSAQGNFNYENVALRQNIFDAGLKLNFLGIDAKVRPYIGGGGAYSQSFVNYDQRIVNLLTQSGLATALARDYEIQSFLGYLSAGLDVKVAKNIYVGAFGKYYQVLSAREFGVAPYWGWANLDLDKQSVGASLSRASFYTIQGAVSFVF